MSYLPFYVGVSSYEEFHDSPPVTTPSASCQDSHTFEIITENSETGFPAGFSFKITDIILANSEKRSYFLSLILITMTYYEF